MIEFLNFTKKPIGYYQVFIGLYHACGGINGTVDYRTRECMADQVYASIAGWI